MKYCTNCGNQLNDDERFCKFCGNDTSIIKQDKPKNNDFSLNRVLTVVFLCIGFIILMCIIIPTDDKEDEMKPKTNYKFNETISCDKYDITFNSYNIKTYKDNDYIIDGEQWIALYVTIKNTSNNDITFYESNIEYINNNGEIISRMPLTVDIWKGERLNSPEIIRGGTKTGYIVFRENLNKIDNISFRLNCSLFGNTYIITK